ncbi:hypothetical protein EVAR_77934_1 [Eumeta japonica]|uniref:Uncharacterized protein n=1 Tax=Eumeta variegata TaxID=151549 RepID=A0A4C1XVQ7_EUMVA|nr:hypothetical protein EVAR_77934_1 [Eumeta japonica]
MEEKRFPPNTPAPLHPVTDRHRTHQWYRHQRTMDRGGGNIWIHFLPSTAEEFRVTQRYLQSMCSKDPTATWYCYTSANEYSTKVSIRGLPSDTELQMVAYRDGGTTTDGFPSDVRASHPST